MKLTIEIDSETLQDAIYISNGLYYPLRGFMTKEEYKSVVNNLHLITGDVWPLPVTLAVPKDIFSAAQISSRLYLKFDGKIFGYLEISDCFITDAEADCLDVFKTNDSNHPGVKKELSRSKFRVGGEIFIEDESILNGNLYPEKTKIIFADKGWDTIVGFQTRNPLHTAHEYLHRFGLELCDGLFINPSIGWKKKGDFTEEAINAAYKVMIEKFYPDNRVYFEGFRSYFRYAGPREAIFHAILRRNLGCTHFIIGRDHAGIGNYYGAYEAQKLAKIIDAKTPIGIHLLLTCEPYYCSVCNQIVTQKHCNHSGDNILKISGSNIRSMLKKGLLPDKRFLRPEISKELLKLKDNLFIVN